METVTLKPLFHRGAECIGIYTTQNATLNHYFQKHAGAKWSRTHKCWYMPCTEKNYEILAKVLKGKAVLEVGELRKYLLEKKNAVNRSSHLALPVIPQKNLTVQKPVVQHLKQTGIISKENKDALQKFQQQLVLKSYSLSTIRTYTNEFMQFLQLIKNKPANEFDVQRIHPVGLKKNKN